jgi:hypothetical protein
MRIASLLAMLSWSVVAGAGEAGKKVEYDTFTVPYFVKNNAPVKENPAHLVLTDKKQFDQVFGVGFTMKKPKTIDPKAFDRKIAVVVIKKGNAITKYTVQQVTAAKGELRVEYQAMEGKAGTATFASPLIVMVDRRDYARVVFVENGKEVAKVDVKK